jgi:anti-anti-sigma factor
MLFDARTLRRDGWTVVSVVGEIDLATLTGVRRELGRAEGDRVAIDLSSVDYIDPLALGVLIAGALRVTRRDGRFVVVSPAGRARDLLAETRLDEVLEVVAELPPD